MIKKNIKDNILSINSYINSYNPKAIADLLRAEAKKRRLELNLTQQAVANRADISFGSLKRFENSGEISLKSLIKLAIALENTDGFKNIFEKKNYTSIKEIVNTKQIETRKRGRRNE